MSISLTKTAADQVKKAALVAQLDNTPLRIAATRNKDNSIHYGMGFDDVGSGDEKDYHFESNGVELVVAESSFGLLDGTTIDFVELEPKQFHFVFLNPNDPDYSPPTEG
ncbi:MAG: iron-sulfur cluster assembly accessory protein [Gammaproteobacteria bacterium]|nr:iron-sulfur cluster assembly accessory protein [Gammaproteobacteria bacterium]